jgi:hypothetical protein
VVLNSPSGQHRPSGGVTPAAAPAVHRLGDGGHLGRGDDDIVGHGSPLNRG